MGNTASAPLLHSAPLPRLGGAIQFPFSAATLSTLACRQEICDSSGEKEEIAAILRHLPLDLAFMIDQASLELTTASGLQRLVDSIGNNGEPLIIDCRNARGTVKLLLVLSLSMVRVSSCS